MNSDSRETNPEISEILKEHWEDYMFLKNYIEKTAKIKLTMKEMEGLQKITERIYKGKQEDDENNVNWYNATDPYQEIPMLFFAKFYEIDPDAYINLPREGEHYTFSRAKVAEIRDYQRKKHKLR